MLKMIGLAVALCAPVAVPVHAQSKAPAPATLTLSLKTMSKALAGCRATYTRLQDGTTVPLVKAIIGATDYEKDMSSLSDAETFVNTMAAHPERVTGKSLVATISSTDDFYAGVRSTRLAILGFLISAKSKPNPPSADALMVASTSLADCQAAVFNAGDDFVDLVMNFVGAEDDIVAATKGRK
jgi:hypothetical protein